MDEWNLLSQWAGRGLKALSLTLVSAPAEEAAFVGRMAVWESPESQARGSLLEAPFWPADEAALAGTGQLKAPPAEGRLLENGGRRYFLSPLAYSRSALVLGAGHVGAALCDLLCFLDSEVILMDDRPDFLKERARGVRTVAAPFERLSELFARTSFSAVAIVTRGHAQDSACLRQVLAWPRPPEYLGMIGSRHRIAETLAMLRTEGFAEEALKRLHSPIGLEIGAQTPAEIAVSIAAEIIAVLNKGTK